jgi:hypothetical protein
MLLELLQQVMLMACSWHSRPGCQEQQQQQM